MNETDFALHINGFLSCYLPGQRNLSPNTITSYRDAFKLFLLFCKTDKKMKADKIRISDLTAELLTEYLAWLERVRHCGVRTRNQRLAAFKSFFHYVASMQPEHIPDLGMTKPPKNPKRQIRQWSSWLYYDKLDVKIFNILIF